MVPVWIPFALIALWLISSIMVLRGFDQDMARLRKLVSDIAEDNAKLEVIARSERYEKDDYKERLELSQKRNSRLVSQNSALSIGLFDTEQARDQWRDKYNTAADSFDAHLKATGIVIDEIGAVLSGTNSEEGK